MGSHYQRWEEMEVMKLDWWYKIVAPNLVVEHAALKIKFDNQISSINNLQNFKTALLKTNAELQERISQFVAARSAGDMGCVLTAREHATSQRIRDLESRIHELEALSSKLYTEGDRMRAMLSKFNQR
jgi:hypothetical protein